MAFYQCVNAGGGGASALEDLTDVDIVNLSNGQILKYNATSQKWENADESGGGSTPDIRLFEALTYAEVKASGSPTASFTVNDNVLTSTASSMSNSETNILSTDTIDLTYVNLIEITLHSATFYSGGGWNGFFYVCDDDTNIRNNTYPSVSHKILFSNTSTPVKYYFDVSQLTGNWYVGVCTGGHTNLVADAVAIGTGSGGHTIIDENDTEMTQRKGLQFIGNVSVSDDSSNDKTVVEVKSDVVDVEVNGVSVLDPADKIAKITSYEEVTQAEYDALPNSKLTDGKLYCIKDGDGDAINFVNGVYIDTNNVIVPETQYTGSVTYTATQDCAVYYTIANDNNSSGEVTLDGESISVIFGVQINLLGDTIFVKKGQTLVIRTSFSSAVVIYKVYGVQTGSVSNAQHNYSTSEQVIGTWVDGKPLYERSISIAGVSVSVNQTVTIYTQANIKMKYFSGYLTENDITYVIPEIGVRIRQSGDNIQISAQSGASWVISEGYVTIQYTKTTD